MSTAISKTAVDAFAPQSKPAILWDSKIKGFGLRVMPSGSKSYIFQYRMGGRDTPSRRITIGKHGTLTPDQARKVASDLAAKVALGIDPRQEELDAQAARAEQERQAAAQAQTADALAFEKVAAKWLEAYEVDHRPRSYLQAKSIVDRHLTPALSGKPLPEITRADLQAIIDGIPAKQAATKRNVYAYASVLFGWATRRHELENNPIAAIDKPKPAASRERVLSDEELAILWKATEAMRGPLRAMYRLLMLTGQRREEVAAMMWGEVDRASETWIIPAARAKNGVASVVPLSSPAIKELDRLSLARQLAEEVEEPDAKRWPKAGPIISIRGKVALSCHSQAKTELDEAVEAVCGEGEKVGAWRVHDLRRTLATGLQRLGVRFEVTEAILNHVSGAKGGVAGIYQRHDWKDEKRTALDAWARHVVATVQPATKGNVVALDAAKKSAKRR